MNKTLTKKERIRLYIWTASYFKPFLLQTILYILCGGLLIFGELMIPRRMGYIIDHILPLQDMGLLYTQLLTLCAVAVMILLAKAIFNVLEMVISNGIIKTQQTDMMKKLQSLGFAYYEKVPTGRILALFENSLKEIQRTYTFLFPQFIYSLAQFLVPSIILIKGAPIFFFAAMVGNIIYVFINRGANRKIHYYLGLETETAQVSQQSLYDVIVSRTEIKAMGRRDWLIQKTVNDFDGYRRPRMWSIFWRHFRYTTVGLTLTISTVLFYIYGLELVKTGEMFLGEFIGYSFLMGLVSRGFSVFFYIIPAQYHALNYAKDVHAFMHTEPDVKEDADKTHASINSFDIQLKNVSFAYSKEQPILQNVSITIPAGKKTAIVGESGSGKSTVIKLIGRFYDVSAGEVRIGGKNIQQLCLTDVREACGYVFQDTYLFNMSIRDNIRFGNLGATDEEVVQAAQRASAHDFIVETEKGYDTLVGERGARLSGGQKQRIAIARMFLKDPKIILLDEATSALDTATETAVKRSLDTLAAGRTTVAVAHRLSTIMEYDNIVVLEAGQVVEQGTYQELMDNKKHFHKLVTRGGSHAV